MNEAIRIISEQTGRDWFSVVMALYDRCIITKQQQREIENHFFNLEEVQYKKICG